MSLEELLDLEVTSVSKKTEKLSEAAAAVFVITAEDIQRHGFTSIPDALRMVPGMEVARLDSNKWAVSARGFNGRFANKLLVLVDGQSVYTPLYSGVFWEAQDILLEDLDRIEVIRGPGAALWGANAVNGVVNIITKHSRDTGGGLLTLGGGSQERAFGGLRYGGQLSESTHCRAYVKYFDREGLVDGSGVRTPDQWDMVRGGFRVDRSTSSGGGITLQANAYDGDLNETVTVAMLEEPYMQTIDDVAEMSGASALARWSHAVSDLSRIRLQLSYERFKRVEPITHFTSDIFDVDFQHQFPIGRRHDFVWGMGYRFSHLDVKDALSVSFRSDNHSAHLVSAFVNDEIEILADRLHLILGSKFEHNEYTGNETQPNVRAVWTPREHHTVWGAVARAVRTPFLGENYARFVGQVYAPGKLVPGVPAVIAMEGNPDFESEYLTAWEIGYRTYPRHDLSLDLTAFRNVYDNLRTIEPGDPFFETTPLPLHLLVPMATCNKMGGKTYGVEAVADWQPVDGWALRASYAYLDMQLHLDEDSGDLVSERAEDQHPRHQIHVRSQFALPGGVALDLISRYVDDLPDLQVDGYSAFDLRVGWRSSEHLEICLVGQNLTDHHHPEITPEFYDVAPTEVPRGVYGRMTWRFR